MIDKFFDCVEYRIGNGLENGYSMQAIKYAIKYYYFIKKEMEVASGAFKIDWRWMVK
jgi:hypothetical protein